MDFRRLFRPLPRSSRDLEAELRDEIESHIALCVDALEKDGMTRDEAVAAARARFGDFEESMRTLRSTVRQRSSRVQRRDLLQGVKQDFVVAWRQARRSPAFTAAVVLTLALGVGANAAMFGIVDRLLLRQPSGVTAPDEVRRFYWSRTFSWAGLVTQEVSNYADYLLLNAESKSWADVAAHFSGESTFGRGEATRRVYGSMVTASYWSTLRPRPHLGRFFTVDEDAPGNASHVAVLSYDLWRNAMGADETVIGRRVTLQNVDYTVIGVAEPDFRGIDLRSTEIWVPMSAAAPVAISDAWDTRQATWLRMIGRLRPGIDESSAAAEATGLFRRALLAAEQERGGATKTLAAVDATARAQLASLIEARGPTGWLLRTAKISRWLALMAVLVLVIATANVANLLLARASTRKREVAARIALGASGSRLATLLLAESALYAFLATIVGLLVASAVSRSAQRLLLPDIAPSSELPAKMLLVSIAVMVVVTVLTSLTPILLARRADVVGELKAAGRGATLARSRGRVGLILLQGALSLVLLSGAGLFVRSLHRAINADMGFDADRVVVGWFELSGSDMASTERELHYARMVERLEGRPDVSGAALATSVPFWSSMSRRIRAMGEDSVPTSKDGGPYVTEVSPEYFTVVGTRILRGRAFTAEDRVGTAPVAILSETIARELFPSRDAIGQCVQVGPRTPPCTTVIGIAEDAHRQTLQQPDPVLQYYLPLHQRVGPGPATVLFARATDDPRALLETLRREFAALGPNVPYARIRVLQELIDPQIQPWRLGAGMFAAFGVLALLIAGVGLYSVLAYDVARRRPEFGVRMALGASALDITKLVLFEGTALALGGVLLGLGAAALGARFVEPLLFETSAFDPLIYVAVITMLLAAAIAASIPAVRLARRVDPNTVLRTD